MLSVRPFMSSCISWTIIIKWRIFCHSNVKIESAMLAAVIAVLNPQCGKYLWVTLVVKPRRKTWNLFYVTELLIWLNQYFDRSQFKKHLYDRHNNTLCKNQTSKKTTYKHKLFEIVPKNKNLDKTYNKASLSRVCCRNFEIQGVSPALVCNETYTG